jgi:hypothetical protein
MLGLRWLLPSDQYKILKCRKQARQNRAKVKSKHQNRDTTQKEISDEHMRLGNLCQSISDQLARATEQLSLRIENDHLNQILSDTDDEDEGSEA